jgi:type II restriction enzyme
MKKRKRAQVADVEEAKEILKALDLPAAQSNEMSALTLMALCGLGPKASWSRATRNGCTVTKGVIDYIRERFGKAYAPNTRETFRRQVLHQFVQGHIADYNPFEPDLPTNSPRAHYAITEAALAAVKAYETRGWKEAARKFLAEQGALRILYSPEREQHRVPIRLPDGQQVRLSPGKHNEVQKAVVEEFGARYAPGAELVYLGDTVKKNLVVNANLLDELGIPMTEHDKLPDVVLYDRVKKWLFLIEAVTSHGPVTPKRIAELEKMLAKCPAGVVYVSAFPDMAEFKRHAPNVAWETEVWLADTPAHLIHFNGDRFFGPRSRN